MKIYTLTILILLAGCGGESIKTIAGEEFSGSGYTLEVPDDWQTKKNFMGCDLIALRPSGAGEPFTENINVVLENLPEDFSPNEYYDISIANREKMSGDTIANRESIMLDGRDALKVRYSLTMGKTEMDNDVYMLLIDQSAYIITLSMVKGESREQWHGPLSAIAQTFKVD